MAHQQARCVEGENYATVYIGRVSDRRPVARYRGVYRLHARRYRHQSGGLRTLAATQCAHFSWPCNGLVGETEKVGAASEALMLNRHEIHMFCDKGFAFMTWSSGPRVAPGKAKERLCGPRRPNGPPADSQGRGVDV